MTPLSDRLVVEYSPFVSDLAMQQSVKPRISEYLPGDRLTFRVSISRLGALFLPTYDDHMGPLRTL